MFKFFLTLFACFVALAMGEDAPWSHAELHFGQHDQIQGVSSIELLTFAPFRN